MKNETDGTPDKQPLITFCVPSYNSEAYLHNCIESLLVACDDIEIIIVNDGSKDKTGEIADKYVAKYPQIVRAVHKENGGHGSGVNVGVELARGRYYKVVDSDDHLDKDSLFAIIARIKQDIENETPVDLYVTNYVYENAESKMAYSQKYTKYLKPDIILTWNDKIKRLSSTAFFMMHSLWYNTEKLRESNTVLPEHTYYCDTLFSYKPLPFMKNFVYLDLDVYRYLVGRPDQSVTPENFTKRYAQQIRVTTEMVRAYSLDEIKKMPKGLRGYMLHFLNQVAITTMMVTLCVNKPERRKDMKDFWKTIRAHDKKLARRLRWRYCCLPYFIPFNSWRAWALLKGYNSVRKRLCLA